MKIFSPPNVPQIVLDIYLLFHFNLKKTLKSSLLSENE